MLHGNSEERNLFEYLTYESVFLQQRTHVPLKELCVVG